MTTAAERLVALAGATGTAGALLLLIGSGATAGAALVDYSGLSSATAAVHLMTDVVATHTGGGITARHLPRPARKRRAVDEEETLLLAGLL